MKFKSIFSQIALCVSLAALSAVILIFGRGDGRIASDDVLGVSDYLQVFAEHTERNARQTEASENVFLHSDVTVLPPVIVKNENTENLNES